MTSPRARGERSGGWASSSYRVPLPCRSSACARAGMTASLPTPARRRGDLLLGPGAVLDREAQLAEQPAARTLLRSFCRADLSWIWAVR